MYFIIRKEVANVDREMPLVRKYHFEKTAMTLDDIRLIQIGRTHCSKDYAAEDPVHIHRNWFELTHVFGGRGTIVTNGVETPVRPGDIYLSFPGDIHAVYTDREELLKFNFLSLWPEDPALLSKLEQLMLYHTDPQKRVFCDRDVEYLIGTSISEVILNDEYSADILASSLHQILRHILRAFAGKKRSEKLRVSSAQELCYQMINYICTHVYVMDDLTELADFFGYSYSYLSDLFRKTTGDTLMHCYTSRRLEAAGMLLKEDKLSVSAIAELLRYSSIYTFSRAFKQHFGVSPTRYKHT